jgi:hypothetical protein
MRRLVSSVTPASILQNIKNLPRSEYLLALRSISKLSRLDKTHIHTPEFQDLFTRLEEMLPTMNSTELAAYVLSLRSILLKSKDGLLRPPYEQIDHAVTHKLKTEDFTVRQIYSLFFDFGLLNRDHPALNASLLELIKNPNEFVGAYEVRSVLVASAPSRTSRYSELVESSLGRLSLAFDFNLEVAVDLVTEIDELLLSPGLIDPLFNRVWQAHSDLSAQTSHDLREESFKLAVEKLHQNIVSHSSGSWSNFTLTKLMKYAAKSKVSGIGQCWDFLNAKLRDKPLSFEWSFYDEVVGAAKRGGDLQPMLPAFLHALKEKQQNMPLKGLELAAFVRRTKESGLPGEAVEVFKH